MSVEQFQVVDLPVPKLSYINLDHSVKLSFKMGELHQLLNIECYPGDMFSIKAAFMCRFMPLIAPIYHQIDMKFNFFFTPNRLCWDKWQDFIIYQLPDINVPTFTMADIMSSFDPERGITFDRLEDLNLPLNLGINKEGNVIPTPANTLPLVALPLRAQTIVWNEYYRHQFLQEKLDTFSSNDFVETAELVQWYNPLYVGWEKDYFTLATTSPQLGSDVLLPVSNNKTVNTTLHTYGATQSTGGPLQVNAGVNQQFYYPNDVSSQNPTLVLRGNSSFADQQFVNVGSINDFYRSKALQRWKYKLQLAGQRYNEQILAKFGVVTPDYRIQRPEHIGSYVKETTIGRVVQTTGTSSAPLGSFSGEAIVFGETPRIDYKCYEHGYLQCFMHVSPKSEYMQGLPRTMIKRDLFDWYDPDFAKIGDQEILNDEIFVRAGNDNGIFGYTLRNAEHKQILSSVRGEFRTSLAYWHLARIFDYKPDYDESFIRLDDPYDNNQKPWDRIFAVVDNLSDNLLSEIYFSIDSYRPMPIDSLPEYITDAE